MEWLKKSVISLKIVRLVQNCHHSDKKNHVVVLWPLKYFVGAIGKYLMFFALYFEWNQLFVCFANCCWKMVGLRNNLFPICI